MQSIVSGILGLVVGGVGVSANLLHGFGRLMLQNFISFPST
jgi:hypothetical protein